MVSEAFSWAGQQEGMKRSFHKVFPGVRCHFGFAQLAQQCYLLRGVFRVSRAEAGISLILQGLCFFVFLKRTGSFPKAEVSLRRNFLPCTVFIF